MFLSPVKWASGLLAVILITGPGASLRAGETSSDKALAKLGLKQAGGSAVLEAESDVHGKIAEARQLLRDLSNTVMQQRGMVSEKEYQATIKELTAETNALKTELNNTNRLINQVPMNRGRYATYMAAQQGAELGEYQQQLTWEIAQRNELLSQLKSQPFDPREKLKIDAAVKSKREVLEKAVVELRKLVDETSGKYKELAKSDEAKKLLSSLERKTGTKLKVQPSRPYQIDVKYLEKLEKEVSSGESATSTEKPARKGRRTKAKRPYQSTDTGDYDSPF